MAIIRRKELKEMNENTLNDRLKDLRMEMLRMNAQKSAQMKNVRIRETKRTIARILTALRQRSKESKFKTDNTKKQPKEKR